MKINSRLFNQILDFSRMESAGGILLMFSMVIAIIVANSPLNIHYNGFISLPVAISIGDFEIAKPLLLWVNDGLMTIFFLLVGLELKREILDGELSHINNVVLPAVGAVGGMLIPALIYVSLNYDNPEALRGWAIPTATDIAFAMGVLSLLGPRIPTSLKLFLISLAIFDDLGAIILIALFYTSKISLLALSIVLSAIIVLFIFNRLQITVRSPYILVGLVMWVATLKSGVHATLAGVILAMFIPMKSTSERQTSPLKTLEHDLHTVVAFFVLPVFAFSNAGISFKGMGLEQVFHSVPIGTALGLFFGKQLGIFGICWLMVKAKLAQLPSGMTWVGLYGTSALCGIGFTMSLFIGSLAFQDVTYSSFDERLGIVIGSMLSGIVGFFVLHRTYNK